ncbi:type VI secretion protein [Salinivibrio proteolyticus]|uniref:Type VI secretion system baseplate subunit TssF n=2 Tax=Salinivibrio TaxID=51366 RepID=A0ABY7LKT0_9GAMM|nr:MULTISPECIES: type VI secretion system baseplate subunit TssF [Salinivibrio]OOF24508.1 type VI secretion protein [Salinivibrio proteolyticus]PCE65673.1 type VI secretion system ImpG/VasA family protein [Salinivibrio sp. YCSC6]QCF37875.1 type VI secretion system baseplate subunit TssF [Salinivibrio sp. YCSC6]QIR07466.1 type VI secretion system baseplate subunit TssF [Salinivibrio costicola]WBA16786.1 type VI secretion system baseplate subunit TssF [Salinivibrio proteolyticus]
MTQDKYFREELAFLKEQGKAFTEIHPQLSRFLHGRHTDPDVERLLEGFAFLTGKLREKVEDDFPELTHSIINMLWPNYLRPVPSMCITQFSPDRSVSEKQVIGQGTELDSIAVMGTQCRFQTCRDVELYPLKCEKVHAEHTREATTIQLQMMLDGDMSASDAGIDSLRFYIGGDNYSAQMIYLWLNHYLEKVTVSVDGTRFSLPRDTFQTVGFNPGDSLLPYPQNVYDGYRILQEYLSFPEAFHFFDISGLDKALPQNVYGQFSIQLHLSKTLPADVRVRQDSFQLFCTPVINLFSHDADPIDLSGRNTEYKVIPSSRKPSHYEVFSIDSVTGRQDRLVDGKPVRGQKRVYTPFESFQHEVERVRNRETLYYRARVKDSIRGDGFESFISFIRGDESDSIGVDEAVSVKLTCTNRQLPLDLGVGDICEPTDTSPPFAEFENITIPTQSLRPVLDGSLLWMLISNLSLNYLSLLSKDALSCVLTAYDFRALVDRQAERVGKKRLDAIEKIESKPMDKLLKGMPVRGLKSTLYLNQDGFGSEGDLYLFGTVLSHFFSLYASINSFHELTVINTTNNETYTWQTKVGMQPLI